jgi:hypothetical protein
MFKRKLFRHILPALLLTLALITGSVSADDGHTLARYFPPDTVMYFDMRTDQAYIDTLDGIIAQAIARATANLDPALLPPDFNVSLAHALDEVTLDAFGGDFQTTVRAWMGDRFAVGTSQITDEEPDEVLLAIHITNREAALNFAQANFSPGATWTQTDHAALTLLTTPDAFNTYVAVSDDVMLVATRLDLLPLDQLPSPSLAESAAFADAIAMLPESAYDSVAFIDMPTLLQQAASSAPQSQLEMDMLEALGPLAVGAVLLDGRAFVTDLAWRIDGDLSAWDTGAADPAFLANIPANTALVMQGTNLRSSYDGFVNTLRDLATAGELNGTSQQEIDEGLELMALLLRMSTGLDLQQDIISWLDGDYALFISYTYEPGMLLEMATSPPVEPLEVPLEFGLLIEATDPDAAGRVVDGLARALFQATDPPDPALEVTREEIAGTEAVVVSIHIDPAMQPVRIAIAANERVLYVGSASSAPAVLQGSGGLTTSADFAAMHNYLLPDARTLFYASPNMFALIGDMTLGTVVYMGPAVGMVFEEVVDELGQPTPTDEEIQQREEKRQQREEELRQEMEERMEEERRFAEMMQQVVQDTAALFNGAAISTTSVDNISLARFVLLLAE